MKLVSIEIENFRQFFGRQELTFASGEDGKNITVFHGFNGAGKTALLNAFVWCLYQDTTPDLENKDRLVNERAFAEAAIGANVTCSVTLDFEYRNERYRVERSATQSKLGQAESSKARVALRMFRVGADGVTETIGGNDEARQHRIHQILPASLHPFFFFNGERVERLAGEDAYERVEAGVKTLLDIELYERAAARLRGPVTRSLAAELRETGDSRASELTGRLQETQDKETATAQQRQEQQRNLDGLRKEIESLERQHEQLKEVAEAANERKRLREKESEDRKVISSRTAELAALVSRDGYLAFSPRALDAAEDQINEARRRGDIPAKIKPAFVDDLINRAKCICGRLIDEDSTEQKALEAWKGSTGLAEIEEEIALLKGGIRSLRQRREGLYGGVENALKVITGHRKRLSETQASIAAISERIEDGEFGDHAAQLQMLAKQRQTEAVRAQVAIERYSAELAELEGERASIHKELQEIEAKTEKESLAQKQLAATQRVAEAFDALARIQKNDVRQALDEKIREIWNDAAIKDYSASVSDNYQLTLTKMVGGIRQKVTGASTGEKQVLALSFVGALVRKARENVGSSLGVETGGFFPLVMDSPFGSLEDEYRHKVATWLPNLGNQIIVMVSNSQWRHEVETAMRSRIGREYILELHTPKRTAARAIRIEGAEHSYVVHDEDGAEMTIIRRVD
jgi:DNA sulfur modification protein DndD